MILNRQNRQGESSAFSSIYLNELYSVYKDLGEKNTMTKTEKVRGRKQMQNEPL